MWTETDIPDQSGRTALITGANSGLGLQSAKALAAKGARVLLACRSAERGAQALREVQAVADTAPQLIALDLADLSSVHKAAGQAREATGDALDVLINNAGLMATPRSRTADGFELQFGTNYLGHAALTWLLMPALRGGTGARVVTLTSVAAIGARVHLDDPNFEHRRYNPGAAYGQSKLANQTFALELDRRLRAADEDVLSVVAAPGYTATGLTSAMARSQRLPLVSTVLGAITKLGDALLAQNVRMGALPQLYAATAPEVNGGDYIGPKTLQLRGEPVIVQPLRAALDRETGAGLWQLTAKLTGITPDPS
ncbi:NAD(P)-dependent dehydrogenase (short-subunit alcohol dehydrogenase family) [Amycolatopsis bartoniae]|uniref:Short-chain dehydrogenase n=1 Tax=Amycolatopsis bartoniae TaxID=941986 RepID=A0A8H9MF82_9PSEU|nr:oxidoreductase [Amycolatopsis bartoniae]MBB2934097.1 NAD(P)-dependent dehydrogenase (short-subunit alcohol dehydrogenase family) [Amycolatopsis bartoniae]TVT07385.1 SDR family NAD(P)-dependent oxidoreductase [Amycolatopsis bartoniae]GHF84379.1 short-chain dehydrogenase [Amycolatopsis bartoniae]